MKIKENNKLIAAFMGVKESDELYKGHPTFVGDDLRKAGLPFNTILGNCIDNPPFHSSWDWLMPVVDKIGDIKFPDNTYQSVESVFIEQCYHRTFGMRNEEGYYMFRFNGFQLFTEATLKEAAYMAVVDFIKWYNEKKEKQL